MTTNETKNSPFGDVIYQYSRAQAIEDGLLIDVTEAAKEMGIVIETALTRAVWESCVALPKQASSQDAAGRLYYVLTVLRFSIIRGRGDRQVDLTVAVRNDSRRRPRPVRLKAICGAGDSGEPVITIMLPEED